MWLTQWDEMQIDLQIDCEQTGGSELGTQIFG